MSVPYKFTNVVFLLSSAVTEFNGITQVYVCVCVLASRVVGQSQNFVNISVIQKNEFVCKIKEYISDQICERTDMAPKGKIFVTVT